MAGTWNTLAEMDARFAQSRARARERRAERPEERRRPRLGPLAAVTLLAVAAGAAALAAGGSDDRPGSSPAATPTDAHVVYRLPASCRVPVRFQRAFVTASRDTGLPLSLLVAVAWEESRMKPHARSHAGALGLLQLMPATARALELDAGRPATNILAGARYLRRMLTRFGDLTLALSAYNAGPAAVERAGGAPTVSVLRYAANVEARARTLTRCDTG